MNCVLDAKDYTRLESERGVAFIPSRVTVRCFTLKPHFPHVLNKDDGTYHRALLVIGDDVCKVPGVLCGTQ